jgi:hypothetical protein
VSIPADDVTFVAVLRRGYTEHTRAGRSCVLAEHVGEWEAGVHLVFRMSLLEATALQGRLAEFGDDGVMGRWKLLPPAPGLATPSVKLVAEYDDACKFLADAAAPENPEWVRRSYTRVLKQ